MAVTVSDGRVFKNINKGLNVKRLEKRLRREQRHLSRKYEFRKKKGGKTAAASANIDKQKLKVHREVERFYPSAKTCQVCGHIHFCLCF